jgi:S-DNA-T family DNA segregation ATPase FtsK/SpoIIIE
MNEQQQGTWYLKIVKGPVPGQTFAIERSQVVVGRDPTCDIVIDAPSVSRRHAQLTYQTGWFYVQDLGSANGIVVDGKRVAGSQRIGP